MTVSDPRKHRIRPFWQHWTRSEWIAAIFFVLLLAAEFFSLGCDGFSALTDSEDILSSPDSYAQIDGTTNTTNPGQSVNRTLSSKKIGQGATTHLTATSVTTQTVNLKWYPPSGTEEIQFDPQYPPVNPTTGPPYIWQNIPVGTTIQVTYRSPRIPPGRSQWVTADLLAMQNDQSEVWTSYAIMPLVVTTSQTDSQVAATHDKALSRPGASSSAQKPAQNYRVWNIDLYLDGPPDQTLTTERCQTWADFVQQDSVFLALNYPLPNPAPTNSSTLLPVVFYGDRLPMFRLNGYGAGNFFEAPLTYAIGYFDFLENMLPTPPGTQWLALQVAAPTTSCPQGLAADEWGGQFSYQLDFGGDPESCLECEIVHYFCYEGNVAPPFFPASSLRGGSKAIQPAYQGEGITCMGPISQQLNDQTHPVLLLLESHMGQATAGEQVSYYHFLQNQGDTDLTVDFALTSEMHLPWGLYKLTDLMQPDLTQPINGPVTVSAGGDLWFTAVLDVPADAAGMETLMIDASTVQSPTLTAHTSDALWIGGWLTPPPPAPTATPTVPPTATPTPIIPPTATPTPRPQAVPLYLPVVLHA